MVSLMKIIIFFLSVFTFVSSIKVDPKCELSVKDMKDFILVINEKFGRPQEIKDRDRCTELLWKSKLSLDKLENVLREAESLKDDTKRYNVRLEEFLYVLNQNWPMKLPELSAKFGSPEKIEETCRKIVSALRKRADFMEKARYFDYSLSNITYTGVDQENICALGDDSQTDSGGKQLISLLGEFRPWKFSTHNFQSLMRLEAFVTSEREFYAKVSEVYRTTMENVRTLIENNLVSDEYGKVLNTLNKTLNDLTKEIDEIVASSVAKGLNATAKIIRSGKNFREAKEILKDVETFNDEAFNVVLNKAFDFDVKNLQNVLKFIKFYNKGENVTDIMKGSESLSENVYEYLAQKIEDKQFEDVVGYFKTFKSQVIIDSSKLIKIAYANDVNNTEALMEFIDKIDDSNRALEDVLYEEIVKTGNANPEDLISFGFWLKEKLPEAVGSRKRKLTALKLKLPEGIKNLCCEDSFILKSRDLKFLFGQALQENSVKLKAIPTEFPTIVRLVSVQDNRALFISDYAEKSTVSLGTGDFDAYYWQILPNRIATTFTFKNLKTGDFLSSRIKCGCRNRKWGFLWCIDGEIYNKGHPRSNSDSQKWTIIR